MMEKQKKILYLAILIVLLFVLYYFVVKNIDKTPVERVLECTVNNSSWCDNIIIKNNSLFSSIDEQIEQLKNKQKRIKKENDIYMKIKELYFNKDTESIEKLK